MPVKATQPFATSQPLAGRATLGLIAAIAAMVAFAAFAVPFDSMDGALRDAGHALVTKAIAWSGRGMARAPVLMAALAIAVALALLAGAMILREILSHHRALVPTVGEPMFDVSALSLVETVWVVERVDGVATGTTIGGEMVRVGRHEDNDLVLDHPTVHRHHAILCRTEDDGLAVFDLTCGLGNGIAINGIATTRAALSPGDRLTLGAITLAVSRKPRAEAVVSGVQGHAGRLGP